MNVLSRKEMLECGFIAEELVPELKKFKYTQVLLLNRAIMCVLYTEDFNKKGLLSKDVYDVIVKSGNKNLTRGLEPKHILALLKASLKREYLKENRNKYVYTEKGLIAHFGDRKPEATM